MFTIRTKDLIHLISSSTQNRVSMRFYSSMMYSSIHSYPIFNIRNKFKVGTYWISKRSLSRIEGISKEIRFNSQNLNEFLSKESSKVNTWSEKFTEAFNKQQKKFNEMGNNTNSNKESSKLSEQISKYLREESKSAEESAKQSTKQSKSTNNANSSTNTKETLNKGSTSSQDTNGPPITPQQSFKFDLITLLIFMGIAGLYRRFTTEKHLITWNQMVNDLLIPKYIDHVVVHSDSEIYFYLKKDIPNTQYKAFQKDGSPIIYILKVASIDNFERRFEQVQREMGITTSELLDVMSAKIDKQWTTLAFNLVILALLFYFPYKLMKGGMSHSGFGGLDSILNVGKAKISETKPNITFADVAGIDEAKQEVMEFIDFLKNPEKYNKIGAKIPKGALFVGPPGTGKTLLAKASAGEANVPFLSMSGSDFVEMYVGVGPSRVRDLFTEARKKSPCIIFIDEIDAVARKRSNHMYGSNDERESTLNQMLVEMDGFKERDGVVVFASTNRVDILDPALLRPGRFDRQITVDPPDIRGRKQIAMIYAKKMNLDEDIERFCEKVAELTPGLTGADIQNILNESCIAAARRNATQVSFEDLYKGIDRVLGGIEKKNKVISKEEKYRIAIHEAGHALMGWFMTSTDPLLKVTIVPRGPAALGYAQYLPQDIHLYTKSELYEKLCVFMGGRAAEQYKYGEYSIGGADDLEKATKLAYGMVTTYGFGKTLGQVNYNNQTNGYTKPYSESTGKKIDEEVLQLINSAFDKSIQFIENHSTDLFNIANLLLEKETITYEDLQKLLGKRSGTSPQSYQDLIQNAWSSTNITTNMNSNDIEDSNNKEKESLNTKDPLYDDHDEFSKNSKDSTNSTNSTRSIDSIETPIQNSEESIKHSEEK